MSISEHYVQELQLGCTFSFENFLKTSWKHPAVVCAEAHRKMEGGVQRKRAETLGGISNQNDAEFWVLEKEDVGKRKWEADEKKDKKGWKRRKDREKKHVKE